MKYLVLAVGILTILLLRLFIRVYQLKVRGGEFKFYKINWFWFWAIFIAFYSISVVVILLWSFIDKILG